MITRLSFRKSREKERKRKRKRERERDRGEGRRGEGRGEEEVAKDDHFRICKQSKLSLGLRFGDFFML